MESSASPPPAIEHRAEEQCFASGGGAVLEYRLEENRMIFARTFVPADLRGQSLAARLTEAALAYAATHGYEVVPECTYTAAYLRRHHP